MRWALRGRGGVSFAMILVERSTDREFLRQAASRLGTLRLAKTVGLSLGLSAFFVLYFQLLRHPQFPVTIMPLTALDRWVGFRPWALPLYLSLWLYVPLPFVLLGTARELRACGAAAVALSAIGLGIFWRWPTAVPVLGSDWAAHPSFAFLKAVDAAGNACPSLHVGFAVFAAVRLDPLLCGLGARGLVRMASGIWCAGIVYSTLATGQHVFIDALAGIVLGAIVACWRLPVAPAARPT